MSNKQLVSMSEIISIVVPVYNHAHTLERCFKSIEDQIYRPLEIIVVNDGSTDNSGQVMSNIKISLPVKIIGQQNQGASAARNRGLKETTGEYVIFWDADTVARPEMLAKMCRALHNHPEASYAYSQFKFGWKKFNCQPFNAEDLKKNNYVDTTALIRKRALFGLVGPFDESLKRFQDWDLWLTLLEQNQTGILVPEVLYTKIVHGRKGMSLWLPKFVYKSFKKISTVKKYEESKQIVLKKHSIIDNCSHGC